MVLRRWEPFSEMRRMHENMDRLWRGLHANGEPEQEIERWAIPLDVIEEGDNVVVQASMPGVSPDDIDVTAPLTIYDKTVERDMDYESFGEFRLRAHEGDVLIPKVQLGEPLREQTAHFLDCVESREKPLSDGRNGLEVVAVLEAVQKSMDRDGAPVAVELPR